MTLCRSVSFAGRSIAIDVNGDRAAAVVEFLFGNTQNSLPTPSPLTLSVHSDAGRLRLYREDVKLWEGHDEGELADWLLREAGWQLAVGSTEGVVFHAAVLASDGLGVVLPGASGAGKTSLAAVLTSRGLDYLSDEFAYLPRGSRMMQGFGRPLHVRQPVLASLEARLGDAADVWRTRHRTSLVQARALGAWTSASSPVRLIVFPHYDPEAARGVCRLTKARTGLRLVETVVNGHVLPDYGFAEVARLARDVPGLTLQFSDLDLAADEVVRVLRGELPTGSG